MRQQASASVAMSLTQDLETLAGQEIAVLESWLDHELECESTHLPLDPFASEPCSVVATFRTTDCCGSRLICTSRAETASIVMQLGGKCFACKRPIQECRTLREL
jgi:hypothetical protein